MENVKIEIRSLKEGKAIQKAVISLGGSWVYRDDNEMIDLDRGYVAVTEDLEMIQLGFSEFISSLAKEVGVYSAILMIKEAFE